MMKTLTLGMTVLFSISISIAHAESSASCLNPGKNAGPYDQLGFPADTLDNSETIIKSPEEELELIYSLLSYAVVYKNWQMEQDPLLHNGRGYSSEFAAPDEIRNPTLDQADKNRSRGHNFGAVLVNPNNEVVHWARNHNHALCDETQHGETRLMQQYLSEKKTSSLKNFTIYVTGDSCPMCAGMMSQQNVSKAVMGLSNPFFGKNFDRMNMNSRACGPAGTRPVPGTVTPVMSSSLIRRKLDQAFRIEVVAKCGSTVDGCTHPPSQTVFLKSMTAHNLFKEATRRFLNYKMQFPNATAKGSRKTNLDLYKDSVAFLRKKVTLQEKLPEITCSKN